jgi:disease resistance protein RPM1
VENIWIKDEEKILCAYDELDEFGVQQVQECIKIGLECVHIDQKKRPSINEIVKKLNGE